MSCARCQTEIPDDRKWCAQCETDYDIWSRRHASDIVWSLLAGTLVVVTAGMVMPLLGVPWIFATTGVFAGFGTLLGLHRWNRRRRRQQFLAGAAMPRAYLPDRP